MGALGLDSSILETPGLDSGVRGPPGLDSGVLGVSGLDSGLLGAPGLDSSLMGPPVVFWGLLWRASLAATACSGGRPAACDQRAAPHIDFRRM